MKMASVGQHLDTFVTTAYRNGKLKQISTFSKNGEVKGRWVTYDSIGNITSDINY